MPVISRIGAAAARGFGLFGKIAAVVDAYFNYVTLLLPGNGTNGAQNNTFLDSSTNAFTITRNGNTTQGTFSPFSQTGWGNYFDGSSYISAAYNSVFAMNTYATFECWVNFSSLSADRLIFGKDGFWISYSYTGIGVTTNKIGFGIYNGSSWTAVSSTTTPAIGQWYHVAGVRDNTTLRIYINGTQEATVSFASTPVVSSYPLCVGAGTSGTSPITGYISNARYCNGATSGALPYTANFTPSTTPLTATSATVFLTSQSNRFVDNSSNAFAITANGSPSVQAFSPFAPTAAWSASTNGGSGYFDGSGDYLSLADNAAFQYGTGDFTIEFWFYMSATAGSGNYYVLYDGRPSGTSGAYVNIAINNATPESYVSGSTVITGSALSANTWYHFAYARSGTSTKMFVNGTQVGSTYTDTTNYVNGTSRPVIGTNGFSVGTSNFNGYLSNYRVVKGTAVYTANFTPPTAPLTAISGTSLLLSATNGGIVDATAKNDLETVGNAQISTTQSKFGGSSMYFDGTGDWLYGVTNDPRFGFGTGDFTIEFWAWKSANGSAGYDGVLTVMSGSTTNWLVELSSTRGFLFYNKTSAQFCQNTTTTGINDSTWHHWAICRSGSTWYLFKDGTALTKNTDAIGSSSISGGTIIYVGNERDGAFDYNFNGYIDDLRITKGVARYTSNFTPPTTAFPLQ